MTILAILHDLTVGKSPDLFQKQERFDILVSSEIWQTNSDHSDEQSACEVSKFSSLKLELSKAVR